MSFFNVDVDEIHVSFILIFQFQERAGIRHERGSAVAAEVDNQWYTLEEMIFYQQSILKHSAIFIFFISPSLFKFNQNRFLCPKFKISALDTVTLFSFSVLPTFKADGKSFRKYYGLF